MKAVRRINGVESSKPTDLVKPSLFKEAGFLMRDDFAAFGEFLKGCKAPTYTDLQKELERLTIRRLAVMHLEAAPVEYAQRAEDGAVLPENVDHIAQLAQVEDLKVTVKVAPKTWRKIKRRVETLPWDKLVTAKIWNSDRHKVLRERLRGHEEEMVAIRSQELPSGIGQYLWDAEVTANGKEKTILIGDGTSVFAERQATVAFHELSAGNLSHDVAEYIYRKSTARVILYGTPEHVAGAATKMQEVMPMIGQRYTGTIHIHVGRDDVLTPRSAGELNIDLAALLVSPTPLVSHRTFLAHTAAEGVVPAVVMALLELFAWSATATFRNVVLVPHPRRPANVSLQLAAALSSLTAEWQVAVVMEKPTLNRSAAVADLVQLTTLASGTQTVFDEEMAMLRAGTGVTRETLKEVMAKETVVERQRAKEEREKALSQRSKEEDTDSSGSSDSDDSSSDSSHDSQRVASSQGRTSGTPAKRAPGDEINMTAGALRPDLQKTLAKIRSLPDPEPKPSPARGPGHGLSRHKVVRKEATEAEKQALTKAGKKREASTGAALAASSSSSSSKRPKKDDAAQKAADREDLLRLLDEE